MIDVWIELWCDIKDSAPFYTIGDSINQKVTKLLYTNWSHYSYLVQWIDKGTAWKNKMKIQKKEKQKKSINWVFKSNENHHVNFKLALLFHIKLRVMNYLYI